MKQMSLHPLLPPTISSSSTSLCFHFVLTHLWFLFCVPGLSLTLSASLFVTFWIYSDWKTRFNSFDLPLKVAVVCYLGLFVSSPAPFIVHSCQLHECQLQPPTVSSSIIPAFIQIIPPLLFYDLKHPPSRLLGVSYIRFVCFFRIQ